ncbi:MAG: hypothetical protein QOH71_583 [Blastocatellia bacterium]|jgi:hypothetical protein|nr:hypothetical protein [Blastocatellia bacterium]
MKKVKSELNDWSRPEYKRSDFGEMVRGKYAKRIQESTNVIVLDPKVAKAFPNDEAVNNALRGLIGLPPSSTRSSSKRKSKSTEKRRAA